MEDISLIGRLVQPAQYRTVNDSEVANLRLACKRGQVDKDGNPYTDYHNVTLWGKNAQVAHKYTTTGSLIGISGQLENDDYKKNDVVYHREFVYGHHISLLETKRQTLAHKASLREQQNATSTDEYKKSHGAPDFTTTQQRDQPLSSTSDEDWFPF